MLDLPLGLQIQLGSFYHGQCQVKNLRKLFPVTTFPTAHVFFVPDAIHLLVHDLLFLIALNLFFKETHSCLFILVVCICLYKINGP